MNAQKSIKATLDNLSDESKTQKPILIQLDDIPQPTSKDAGKTLVVNEDAKYVLNEVGNNAGNSCIIVPSRVVIANGQVSFYFPTPDLTMILDKIEVVLTQSANYSRTRHMQLCISDDNVMAYSSRESGTGVCVWECSKTIVDTEMIITVRVLQNNLYSPVPQSNDILLFARIYYHF